MTTPSLITRRTFCGWLAASTAMVIPAKGRSANERPRGMELSIGNYGLRSSKTDEAIQLIAGLGFDGIELTVMPEWDSSAANLNADRRKALHRMLVDRNLSLTSLMENLTPSASQTEHQKTVDRLKMAAELAHDLSPGSVPLIQTVLGGGLWNEKKELFCDRLADWRQVAESTKTVIAIKPHRAGALSEPQQAIWLLGQLGNSAWLGMVYDYSHYAMRDLSIAQTVTAAFPSTVLIAVKDVTRNGDQFEFALPGEANTIDHAEILSAFDQRGYRGSVCCEVSSQVSRRAGYDGAVAAKACYDHMKRVFEKAGIPRRRRISP